MRAFFVCTILDFSWDSFWNFLKTNPTVVSGLLGVLIGGTITIYVTRLFYKKKRQDDVSFKLVDQYFEKLDEIRTVKGLLSEDTTKYDNAELNQIIKLGNWYNFANGLDRVKMTSNEILGNMPLGIEISEFINKIKNKSNLQEDENFKNAMQGWNFLFSNESKKSWELNFNIFNKKFKLLMENGNERKG